MIQECEYCKSDKNEVKNLIGIAYATPESHGTVDIYVGRDIDDEVTSIVFENCNNDDLLVHSHPINYCPICGRNLRKEVKTMTKQEAIDRLDMITDIFPEDDEAVETIEKVQEAIKNGFDD
jgi:hypothetical protein